MDYETFRQLADSWGLVYLCTVFVGVVVWAFRPGSKKHYEAAAKIPLDED
ncbi:MAG: cbb3-type cytochrome c oxidase subunit 3 [Hyphomicrobiales bacterium]|nr:cbb3-type cytochrome c oxidase subunit 3 [Hyphomicrobiales bacterium]